MDKLRAALIYEMLGKPKENIIKTLATHIENLGKEKGVKVINKKLHEPKPVKDSKELFTTFAEVEVEFDSLNELFGVSFAYMPANIELIYPEKLTLTNERFSTLLSIMLERLHSRDALFNRVVYERNIAFKKLYEVAPHLFKKKAKKKTK